jgi:Asp-tRNA(Asn)/Glu-tRNA(Gln) amidotransferase B subunit
MVKIRKNSKGQWIDAKTGRFVSKAIYESFARRKAEANAKRSATLKEYWKDVKNIKELYKLTTKEARAKLKQTPKYVEKRGKTPIQWADFWKEAKQGKLSKEQIKEKIRKIEDEGGELISY